MGEGGRHEDYAYEYTKDRKVQAVCSCGWRSVAASAPGMAGAAWDSHRASVTDERS